MASPFQSPRAFPGSPRAQDEEEKCSVCQEPHTEPRILSCLHVFCTKCLQGLLNKIEGGEKLVCPNCRAEYDPPLNVEEFPLDHAVQRSAEFRSFCEAEDEKAGPCKNCEEEGETDAYCGECGGGICGKCVQEHQKMKVFREHKYTAWKDLSEGNFNLHKRQRTCNIHELGIQLYCERCNTFLCSLCLKGRHARHFQSAKSLLEVSRTRQTEVKKMSDHAETQFCVLESRMTELKHMEGGLANYPGSLELSITSTFESYMKQIELYCRQMVNEAQQRCSEMTKGLMAHKTDTENAMEKLKTGIQFAKRAATCTNDDEIIEMSGLAINQLKSTMSSCDISPLRRPLVFEKKQLKLGRLREIQERDIRVEPPEFCLMNTENLITVKFILPINTRPVWVAGAVCKRCDDVMVVWGVPEDASVVKPGPDWKGGEGNVTRGTVLSKEPDVTNGALIFGDGEEQESFKVKVQWDSADVIEYEWGNNDEYELELDM
ncbi:Tripartite motif-containing protein 45 [Geodia barretti]|uniref:Tripartite motif-containing protein 45 n=1 Tax=Geodia barretti TaxID=519541 RepID=A0AA35XFZ5_GEOBA|nr:Tripartite motif-containing protein 45 [Geodia barretti]